jgi:hypothetical protein
METSGSTVFIHTSFLHSIERFVLFLPSLWNFRPLSAYKTAWPFMDYLMASLGTFKRKSDNVPHHKALFYKKEKNL